jgi:hypothetical protein
MRFLEKQVYSKAYTENQSPIGLIHHGGVCTPRLCCGGGQTRRAERGMGGSIFWKTREIGLPLTVKYVLCE